MNLAKIRQKARQEQDSRHAEAPDRLYPALTETGRHNDAAPVIPDDSDEVYIPVIETFSSLPESREVRLPVLTPHHITVHKDPLEAIMAGRVAAGFGEDQQTAPETIAAHEDADRLELLCFKVADEIYGIDIMEIKEIIKPREVTEIPRSPSFVSGIISLRGVIIAIIDMPERLGLGHRSVTGRERVIVVKNGSSFSGLLVDEIIQVVRISKEGIEAPPAVLEGIDRDFVSGIGRADGQMIIILNLRNILDIHL